MHVVLARPAWKYPKGEIESTYNRVWPPLELANCAAILREKGCRVRIVDAHALDLPPGELARRAAGADLVILTSSGLDRWQCPYNEARPFVEAARALKTAGLTVAATGFHGTVKAKAVLAATGADAVIRGEPEGPVEQLAAGARLRELAGASFLEGGELVSNPDAPPYDLERLPVPAFDLLETRRYLYEILGRNFLLFEAARGCPYSCVFCSKVMYGPGLRRKTAGQVLREIDFALEATPVRTAYFMDLEFALSRDLVEEISRGLIARKSPLEWCCQTRADAVDGELAALFYEAGCRVVHIGVESGSERVLESSGKNTTTGEIRRGVRALEDAGIETLCFFLFGLPGERDEDREETIRFALDLDPTYASFHFATPYPGSPLFEESGLTLGDDLSFPLVPPGEDLGELQRRVRRALRRFYLRPGYVLRHIARGRPSRWIHQLRLFLSYFR